MSFPESAVALPPPLRVRRPGDPAPEPRPPISFPSFLPATIVVEPRSPEERFTDTRVVFGMEDAEYRAVPALSQSTIKNMQDGPEQYRAALMADRKSTKAMTVGTAVDWMLTGKRQGVACPLTIIPATLPDAKGEDKPWQGNRKECKEWLKHHQGITQKDWDKATGCAREVERKFADFFIGAATQVALFGKLFGRDVKGLLDVVPPRHVKARVKVGDEWKEYSVLVDVKKVRKGAAPAYEFAAHAWEYGYSSVQGPLYLNLWNDAMIAAGKPEEVRDAFAFIVVEEEEPHVAKMHLLTNEPSPDGPVLARGERNYLRLVRQIIACEKQRNWESEDTGAELLRFPGFANLKS